MGPRMGQSSLGPIGLICQVTTGPLHPLYRSRKARAVLANVVLDPRKITELLQDCLPESHH